MKKNNTWNIRRLVDNSFVPSAQREFILDWRILDLLQTKNLQNIAIEHSLTFDYIVNILKNKIPTIWQCVSYICLVKNLEVCKYFYKFK